MHPEIKTLLYEAEDHYLKLEEIEAFKDCAANLRSRLEAYELLRDHEVNIFQPVADQLLQAFPQQKQEILEQALKYWLSILRYCALAMLANNQEFLQQRLLVWLSELMRVQHMQALNTNLSQSLNIQLKKVLSAEQLALLQPFLDQAKETFVEADLAQPLPA